MVALLPALALSLWLLCFPVWAGEARQLCLSCHPIHYGERGGCIGCHRGNPASERKNIAHHRLIAGRFARFTLGETPVLGEGRRLMVQFGCRRCHVSAGTGNRLATSLDDVADAKSPEDILAAIREPAQGMPDFSLDGQQEIPLVNAILAGACGQRRSGGVRPLVVHFTALSEGKKDVFTRSCGPCHRLLSERRGSLGSGAIGPGLSGLLSPHYPHTFRGKAWSPERVKRWLENPRSIRPWARMRPVNLTGGEFRELLDQLMVTPLEEC